MSNITRFAIDFGTHRIKAAYFDSESDTPRLIKLGADCDAIPALFYVERNSERLYVGEEAERKIHVDPRGAVDLLKIWIPDNTYWQRDGSVREKEIRRNGRKLKPSDLLAYLFQEIQMKIQVEISNDIPLNQVTLTVTAAYSRKERKILEIAAEKANFKKDAVHYLTEPEAAAIEWTRQIGGTKRSVRDLIVLDCGGGTLDIAYLHRSKAGIFQVIRDERGQLDPKGFRIGGCDIDEELLETIGNKLPAHLRQEVERESVLYRKAVRETKELFVDEEVIHPIRIGGNNVVLTETEIRDAIKDKFIEPACRRLASHVKAVKDFGRIPYLLLVGGGAKLKELAKTFKHEFKCEVISDCDRAEFATVLGASCLNQYEYGMENFKNQNYNAAITDFKRAIELNPLDRKAYTGLGQAYFYQGNTKFERKQYNAAITDYDEAIRINPEYDKAYYKRGNTKYALGDYKAAIDDYNAAIRINPEFADAYNNRGLVKCALGDYKAAIDDYNAAIRINPDQILAYHNRGIAKSSLEQYEAAIADYDAAIRINPEYHESHYSRGNAKRALGDYKAAIDDYNAAIRINPEFADAYNNRGLVKCALGDYKAAIDDYNAAIRINPDQILAYHNRGIAKEEILKPLSKKHPEVLRELEALSSILLKLTAKPKHPSVLQVLPLLLEHCVVNLSTEYLRSFHVDLKECEDVLFHNLRQYYLNTGERPFKFKNGELRLTSSVFWHSVVWGLEPMQFLNKIGEQLDEYSQRLIDFLTIPDLLGHPPDLSEHDESVYIDFFHSHRESFKCLKRLAETPDHAEQEKQFWSLRQKAESSLKSIVDERVRTLAKEAEVSEYLAEYDKLLNEAFNDSAVDPRLPEGAYELFEIGGTNGLFRFVDATPEVQTEIKTRLSNLYTLNRNIWSELQSPLNNRLNKDRFPYQRDLKAFFHYFELDCPQKVTQVQAVLMIF